MTEHASLPLGSWLSGLDDDSLIRLLELRPDLAQPAPGSVAALAARAVSRQSVKAASDELDFLSLAALDALLWLGADRTPVPVTEAVDLLESRAPADAVLAALDGLRERALLWGDTEVRLSAEAADALPWFPGQVAAEDPGRSVEEIAGLIEDLDEPAREVLEKLVARSPLGRTRDAAPGTPADRPVQRLLAAGLLRRVDADTVVLPRNVGQLLRGDDAGQKNLTQPGPELRSGGLGVRETKRLAKLTGIDEQRLGLILELTAAGGLIARGLPDPMPPDDTLLYWAPTVAADRFLEAPAAARWLQLVTIWLELPSRPGLIGERGPDGKNYAALSDSLYSTAAPLDRGLLLEVLAELPVGAGVDAPGASRALIWRRPRWAARLQPEPVGHLLSESHALGLTGRGALSSPARALLTGGTDAAMSAMVTALPAPIDHFLIQADLTVVVPGPLKRELAEELAAVAIVESAGAAMVYRVSESSVRHALDTGRTAGVIQEFFEKYSKTPVPQGLTYLIADVARRHGQLRVGMAASFLRCDDPALLTQAVATASVAQLEVRMLAPTVAVSQSPIGELLAALRDSGFAPAAEDSSGAIVDLRRRGSRVPVTLARRTPRPQPRLSRDALVRVVSVLRRVDAAPLGNVRVDPAVAMALLAQAAVGGKDVLMGYVDAAGVATQRVVTPISVHGGHLMAFDPAQGRMREFAVHRVTSVLSADGG